MKTAKLERPIFTEEMERELAKKIVPIIKQREKWRDEDDILRHAIKIMKYHSHDDGFQLAKEFEDMGYKADTMLAEELDMISTWADDIHKESVKKWVQENNIQLYCNIGDEVRFKNYISNNNIGQIVKLIPETAQYGIWNETLSSKTSYMVINSENILEIL